MANFNPVFSPAEREQVLRARAGSHPLEMFPWFRRWKPGFARNLLYTFIWSMGFAVLFTFFGLASNWRLPSANWLWINFVVSMCVGYTLHLIFMLAGRTIEPAVLRSGRVIVTAYYMTISTAGVVIGFWLATGLLGHQILPRLGDPGWILAIAMTSLVISIVIGIIFFWRQKSALAEAALAREQRRAADIEREATVANLRALQAQIEPHFLFNTLANVTSLIDADPARARHMLETFIRFLRATLAGTRRTSTSLADEFSLIRDFLEVLKIRMGDRLEVRMDLPAELAAIEIAPMLVQPVVENAIRHGIEPKVEGGTIELRARRIEGRLLLEIADTGVGFSDATAGGVGLANVRERLRLSHGEAARLSVRDNVPQGTVVALEFPVAAP
ncbi:MAG: histidine kinase [Betaproteobacteria bacterium]|nr:histidine kinase [Betaproteobacteria bacterium]